MNKKLVVTGAVLVVVLLAAAAFFYITVTGPRTATPAHIDDLHMQMNPASLGELEAVIRENADPYTRERAVNVYTDIALQSRNEQRALAFLKKLAYAEKNDDVRFSAYTNYHFIRNEAGILPETTVDIRVLGDIKPGRNITVVLDVTSSRGSTLSTVVVEPRLPQETMVTDRVSTDTDANAGKGARTNVFITPSYPVRKPLPANVTVEFPYSVAIRSAGRVVLETYVRVPYNDRLDYDVITKEIFLDVGPSSGTYTISG